MFTASQCEMVTPILWSFGWEFWAGIVFSVAVICASFVWFFSGKNDEVVASRKVNLERRLDVGVSNDPILEPKHKIFLSHSGVQKEFVEHLCLALESRCHYPFFDKRPSSLPKGEKFANLIFEAVAQCKVLVVVVSDDYFMSKWPMMELHAYVQAMEAMNDRPANAKSKYILPLFYKLSVEEFRDKDRREKWAKEWKKLAKEGGKKRQIDVHAWKKAVGVLENYNGISYNRELQEIKAYYDEIVSHICGIVSADVKWDDSHVQGKSQICEVLCKNIESVGLTEKYKCKIVGIFGVGGIGKTTACKTLCNELSDEYEGRVCHIELETQAKTLILVESLRKLVILLTNKNSEFVQNLDEGQCKHILRNSGVSRRTFIAVDNVWDNHESLMQAKTILDALKFHEGSLVIVSARSQSILGLLGIHGEACVEMPELGEADAAKLFLYHATGGKQFVTMEEQRDSLECIQRCHFSNGGGSGFHYHPLALKSLGIQANFIGEKSSEWVGIFSRVRSFNYLGGGNPVFDILRSSFDMLRPYEQSLFMDLVVFRPFFDCFGRGFESDWAEMVEWLCLVHRVTEDAIKSRMDSLMRKGLLQGVDWTSGRIIVHDLYMEFATKESEGMFNESKDFEHWRYIRTSIDSTELQGSPSGGCWQNLNRVRIYNMKPYHQATYRKTSLDVINWKFYSNVVVLDLEPSVFVGGSLNLEGMNCLRSLYIREGGGLERVEGLDGLRNLAFFKWLEMDRSYRKVLPSIEGQLPTSLEVFDLRLRICLNPDVLVRCSNLVKLELRDYQTVELKLSSCSKLQSLWLISAEKLHSLYLPSNLNVVCGLKVLKVGYCHDLLNIQGLEECIGLEQLRIRRCRRYRLPDLQNMTRLQVFELEGAEEVFGCSIPFELRKLYYDCRYSNSLESNKVPSLRGCKQLELLDLLVGGCTLEDTNLNDLEDLPALQRLTLRSCRISSGWPDLSKSRKLEVICIGNLDGYLYEVVLEEDDIRMLMSLPLLQPLQLVHFGRVRIMLDVHRRKVLRLDSSTNCWAESDFPTPPIQLNNL